MHIPRFKNFREGDICIESRIDPSVFSQLFKKKLKLTLGQMNLQNLTKCVLTLSLSLSKTATNALNFVKPFITKPVKNTISLKLVTSPF